jgi:hypothetical protein
VFLSDRVAKSCPKELMKQVIPAKRKRVLRHKRNNLHLKNVSVMGEIIYNKFILMS